LPDYGKNNENLPDDLVVCLKELVDDYEKEDAWVRKQQIKLWKKNDEFWHGIQFIFWSESRQDWISPTDTRWFQQEEGREEAEGPFYDFVANIYRAHGEAIIAALSSQIPAVRFPPDDADDEDDISTSQVYAKISDLIQRHNKFKIVFLRALFTMWNQGVVGAYHASRTDKSFGEVNIPNYRTALTCPNCETEKPIDEEEEYQGEPCPTCGGPLQFIPVLDGFDHSPKSRVMIECFSPLFFKVSYQVASQKETPYLVLNQDRHKAFLKHIFPHCADAIDEDKGEQGLYERMARTPSSYSSYNTIDENRELMTHKRAWLRYWAFEKLGETKKEEKKKLQKLFPNGVRVEFVGTKYACSRDEDVDKHWTIGQCGLSQFIHCDPMGQSLIPIQEITNVNLNLTQETIEHGIPSGFADPGVLDFEVYSRHEARPGIIYPARPRTGQRLADAFYEGSRATLSREVAGFAKQLEQLGQFVTGSFPSIYGGAAEGKSRTASEYNMSRQMALQRLTIAWSLITDWTARMLEKCVHLFVENMIEDERYVTKNDDGDYINVWIKRAELSGHVGEVESEGSESFPLSQPQKQALLMKLIEMNNEFLNQALYLPQNRKLLRDYLSNPDFTIPGDDQRAKQSREIRELVRGEMVNVDQLVDEHPVHIQVLRAFMVGGPGLELQKSNPLAYARLAQHLQQHIQAMAPPPQAPGQAPGQAKPGVPPPKMLPGGPPQRVNGAAQQGAM